MKKALIIAVMMVAGFAWAGSIETFQIGGLADDRNEGWNQNIDTNTPLTGIHTFSSIIDPDLVVTVTPVANGDALFLGGQSHIAVDSSARQTDENTGRITQDEALTVTVSYVDPNNSLLGLSLKGIGSYWGNNSGETTVFTDASLISYSVTAQPSGTVMDYSLLGLDALTKDNTGTWSMTVSADNTLGTTSSGLGAFQLELDVDPTLLAPIARDDSYALPFGVSTMTTNAPGVLANDFGDSVVLATNVANGTLALNSDGSFTYTATPGFEGIDTFAYSAVNANGTSAPAIVSLEVELTPIANDDTYLAAPGSLTISIPAPGVLDNDYAGDFGASNLFAQIETDVSSGTLILNTDGSFDYTAASVGTNTFTYTAYADGIGFTSTAATVTLITEPGLPPGSVITQTVDDSDWNAAIWGTPAAIPEAGFNYFSDGSITPTLRFSAAGTGSTFPGDSITVTNNVRVRIKNRNNTSTINGDLTLYGSRINYNPGGSAANSRNGILACDRLIVKTASLFDFTQAYANSLRIAGVLTGPGDISISGGGAQRFFIFDSVSNYTGAITVSNDLGIEFGSDVTLTNSLTLNDTSVLYVNAGQTLTFDGGLEDANGSVAAGTYTGVDLDALGTNYVNNGGTLVVASSFVNTPSSSIGFESVDSDTIKWTISLPATADPSAYYPNSTDSLVAPNWTGVAHSDAAAGTYAVSNLTFASGDATNKVIYVKSTDPVEFFSTVIVE